MLIYGKLSKLTNSFNTDTERDRGRIGDAHRLQRERKRIDVNLQNEVIR